MKIRGLISASLVFFALAGVLYWSEHRKPADSGAVSADAPPSILKLDEAAITKLAWKKKDTDPVVLEKENSGNWRITAPKSFGADQSVVSGTLSALSGLSSERLVDDKAIDLKRYGLDQPPVDLKITDKNNKTHELQIGDDTPTGSAAYAKLADDPRVFTIASYVKGNIDKNLNDLRDKRLLTVASDKVSRIELVRKQGSVEFGREKNDWQIIKPHPMRADSTQVTELLQKLVDARMELGSRENDEALAAFSHANPIGTAKVTDQSGIQQIQVRKDKDTYYAKSSVAAELFKVGSDIGQLLEKSLDDFRNKKLFDLGFDDPSRIDWHSKFKTVSLSKNGDDWWADGKKMDSGDMQASCSPNSDPSRPASSSTLGSSRPRSK